MRLLRSAAHARPSRNHLSPGPAPGGNAHCVAGKKTTSRTLRFLRSLCKARTHTTSLVSQGLSLNEFDGVPALCADIMARATRSNRVYSTLPPILAEALEKADSHLTVAGLDIAAVEYIGKQSADVACAVLRRLCCGAADIKNPSAQVTRELNAAAPARRAPAPQGNREHNAAPRAPAPQGNRELPGLDAARRPPSAASLGNRKRQCTTQKWQTRPDHRERSKT